MIKEEFLQELLKALHDKGCISIFDYTASLFSTQSEEFANSKLWGDQLVRDKLATYTDPEHTELQISNAGKFWIMKGGYESYLKDGQNNKKPHQSDDKADHQIGLLRKEKEELLEARIKFIHYRLVGFWLTIVISSLGFALSLYNLYLILKGRK